MPSVTQAVRPPSASILEDAFRFVAGKRGLELEMFEAGERIAVVDRANDTHTFIDRGRLERLAIMGGMREAYALADEVLDALRPDALLIMRRAQVGG